MLHRIAFSMVKGLTPPLASRILSLIGSEEEFFTLRESSLASRLEFKGQILSESYRRDLLEKARAEMDFVATRNINCIYFNDEAYPARLLECDDAPMMLYTSGKTDLNASHIVSIVGTRNATAYGVNFINKLVDDLADNLDSLLIVSGLAFGCDITAHKRALERGIPTVGVVAHGLDTIYPSEHRSYAARMVHEGGAIVTDYPHATRPHRGNFLARNRIVAGMADCVVVAESAAARGGALHTAKLGMLYNRDVFALPGRTSDLYSGGCNLLIKTNVAHLVESAADIMDTMHWKGRRPEGKQTEMFPAIPPEQQPIVDYIRENGEAQLNALTVATGIPVGQLMGMLVEMEFNGLLLSLPGARYRLA